MKWNTKKKLSSVMSVILALSMSISAVAGDMDYETIQGTDAVLEVIENPSQISMDAAFGEISEEIMSIDEASENAENAPVVDDSLQLDIVEEIEEEYLNPEMGENDDSEQILESVVEEAFDDSAEISDDEVEIFDENELDSGESEEAELIDEKIDGDDSVMIFTEEELFYENMESMDLQNIEDAEEGTLQYQINQAEVGELKRITLDKSYEECLVIPDEKIIELDLNGYTITAVREGEGVLKTISVYGELTIMDSSEAKTGSIEAGTAAEMRGILVNNGGILHYNGGTLSGFQIGLGSGAGILVAPKGSMSMDGGIIKENKAADYGGGIFAYNASSFVLNHGVIIKNEAQNGGGIATNTLPANAAFGDIELYENTAVGEGGAIYFGAGKCDAVFNGTKIHGNKAGTYGGGISCVVAATQTYNDCMFYENVSGTYGGGLRFTQGVKITFKRCKVYQNSTGSAGGGFIIWNDTKIASTLNLTDCEIYENTFNEPGSRNGAGFFANNYTTVDMTQTTVHDNTYAQQGGGFYCGTYCKLTMTECTVEKNLVNTISNSYGAGIYMGSSATFTMTDSIVKANGRVTGSTGTNAGIGIYMGSGTATISGGEISDNRGTGGSGNTYAGGFYCGGSVTLKDNVLINNNTGGGYGAGIYVGGTLTIESATITNNSGGTYGGGVYASTFVMEDGLITKNTAQYGGGVYCGGATIKGGDIIENSASKGGGGIRASSLQMTDGLISKNKATGSAYAGGVLINGTGTSKISGGEISENMSLTSSGGGIYTHYGESNQEYSTKGTLIISGDAKIINNTAGSAGGGICVARRSQLQVEGGTITGNIAKGNGGGIYQTQESTGLSVTGGTLSHNEAIGYGNDICLYNIYATHTANSKSYVYLRPELSMGPANKMVPVGSWYDEETLTNISVSQAISNAEENKRLLEEDDRTGYYRRYTWVDQEAVARIGEVIYPSVQAAVNDIIDGTRGDDSVIYMLKDSTEDVRLSLPEPEESEEGEEEPTAPQKVSMTLDLNGHILHGVSSSTISVLAGTELTIRDTSEAQTGRISNGIGTLSGTSRVGGGLYITGKVILISGTISLNKAANGGAGVYVTEKGKFQMSGGEIRENTGHGICAVDTATVELKGGTIAANTSYGVYLGGTAEMTQSGGIITKQTAAVPVYLAKSAPKYTMKGGSISDNTYSSNGGGVYIDYGTFNLEGGKICNNTISGGSGAAIYQNRGTLNIKSGEISGNKASEGDGGAIYTNTGTLNISGGEIKDNTCSGNGGAVRMYQGQLNITGGTITGNTAGSSGGGVFVHSAATAAKAPNYDFTFTKGQIYGNKVVNYSGNDIYIYNYTNIIELQKATDMQLSEYDCWNDAYDNSDITEKVSGSSAKYYYLTASKKTNPGSDAVARIGETTYTSIQEAVNAVTEENNTIHLLVDDHQESVNVSSGKEIIFDMNGHNLIADKTYAFYLRAQSKLTIQNKCDQEDSEADNEFSGWILPNETYPTCRAAYITNNSELVMQDITMKDFDGEKIGGALLATSGATLKLNHCVIEKCHGSNGGAVYIYKNDANPVTCEITNTKIKKCSATTSGGAVLLNISDVNNPSNKFHIDGDSELTENNAVNGGALYISSGKVTVESQDDILIKNTKINNNNATSGGGVYITINTTKMQIKMDHVELMSNTGTNYGAIYAYGTTADRYNRLVLDYVNADKNKTSGSHAGICVHRMAATISNSTINGNETTTSEATHTALYLSPESYAENAKCYVTDTEINNNKSISYADVHGTVTIYRGNADFTRVKVQNNRVTGKALDKAGAAGIMVYGYSSDYTANNANRSTLQLLNCELNDNYNGNNASALAVYSYGYAIVNNGTRFYDNRGNASAQVSGSYGKLDIRNASFYSTGKYNSTRGIFIYRGGTCNIYDGAMIKDHHVTGNGAGVYVCQNSALNIYGGTLQNNRADGNGAAIYMETYVTHNYTTGAKDYRIPSFHMEGGLIIGNRASGAGGGIYVEGDGTNDGYVGNPTELANRGISSSTKLEILGGKVIENSAGTYGGGVYTGYNGNVFRLLQNGAIYDNRAGLGQDIYGNYNGNYVGSVHFKQNELILIKAQDMFANDPYRTGIGWYDEKKSNVITDQIRGKMVREYALTLSYTTEDIVAVINGDAYTTIQAAVNAIKNGTYDGVDTNGKPIVPEIHIVRDVTESVDIPADTALKLNLNGFALQGVNTALTVKGTLTIVDEPAKQTAGEIVYPAGTNEKGGTISGSGVEAGGGIRVLTGGNVTLESGTICDSRAGHKDNIQTSGGGAVCVDSGTFTMTGGELSGNASKYGSAVLVRNAASTFIMDGGTIKDNTASVGGVIHNAGGIIMIRGGCIENNEAPNGVIMNNAASAKTNIVGSDENNPVIIQGNHATTNGGAIYMANGRVTIGNVQINSNDAVSAGGAIYVAGGVLAITDGAYISSNKAPRGGAVYQNAGKINMIGGVITKNIGQRGGGLAQNPEVDCSFNLMRGGIYDNVSTLTSAGNDIYSKYEGTAKYPGTKYPKTTLIAASGMENDNYNVWKDDTYSGTVRTGAMIEQGEYITGAILSSLNLELTADYYNVEIDDSVSGNFSVEEFYIGAYDISKQTVSNGVKDGTPAFDSEAASKEKTAKQLLEEGDSRFSYSTDTYRVNYDDEDHEYHYIVDTSGNKYEQDQILEWNPGDDSNDTNNLVRSYDSISYKIGSTVKTTLPVTADKKECNVHVWLEAILDCSSEEATFADSVSGFNGYTLSEKVIAGETVQVLRGYKEIKQVVDTARADFNVEVQTYGMRNGATIQPKFNLWVEKNEEETKNPKHIEASTVTVSATGKYNLSLDKNTQLAYTGYFDLRTGEETSEAAYDADTTGNVIYGTMLGYGLTTELFNTTSKGLKGFEIPADPLTFKLNLKGSLYLDGVPMNNGLSTAPYVWAYKENEKGQYGRALNSSINNMNMNWNDEDDLEKTTSYAYNAAPFNSGGGDSGCYNGGNWEITGTQTIPNQEETVLTVKVTGYTFDNSSKPKNTSNGAVSTLFGGDHVKPFSAGYIQLIFPITKEQAEQKENGYMTVHMDVAVSDLDITTLSGRVPESSEEGIDTIKKYWGDDLDITRQHIKNEMSYEDSYMNYETGLYLSFGGGPGDGIGKTNYFNKKDGNALSGAGGAGSTPLDSIVYIGADVNFGSMSYRTDDIKDPAHYIDPEKFNPQTDNIEEFNYMTAMNLLQKFDADAYVPLGGESVVNAASNAASNTQTFAGNFVVTTDEEATDWDANPSQPMTRKYNLTILYGAKPDGSNWTKKQLSQTADDGGVEDMDLHREENLIYFTTLQELYDYFGYTVDERGNQVPNGHCVAMLYQFRNCLIRRDHSFTVKSRMDVTDDFEKTGGTYCTTNDVRIWTTYRPEYKEYYRNNKLPELMYSFNWMSDEYGSNNGVTAYGAGLTKGHGYSTGPAGDLGSPSIEKPDNDYFEEDKFGSGRVIYKIHETVNEAGEPVFASYRVSGFSTDSYKNGYIKTRYVDGSQEPGTHTGWKSGNTLLLYTLMSAVSIRTDQKATGSNDWQTTFNVANGERNVKYEIEPTLVISSGETIHELVENGSQSADVTITIELPKNLNYIDKSLTVDYTDSDYQDGDLEWTVIGPSAKEGTTAKYLVLHTHVSDISRTLPVLNYECSIGNPMDMEHDVQNHETLATKVKIFASYDEYRNLAASAHEASSTIKILRERQDGIYLTTDDSLKDVGEQMNFKQVYYRQNYAQNMGMSTVNVLPYNGDGRGTEFDGGYRINGVKLTFNNEATCDEFLNNGVLKYAKALKTSTESIALEQFADGKLGSSLGTPTKTSVTDPETEKTTYVLTYPLTSELMAELTQKAETNSAIGFYMHMDDLKEAKSTITLDIDFSPLTVEGGNIAENMIKDSEAKGQVGGNKYIDTYYYSDSNGPMDSSPVSIVVVNRKITGIVWMDQDQDGWYTIGGMNTTSPDRLLKDIDVHLWRVTETGQKDDAHLVAATDGTGNVIPATKTDINGRYAFENLPAGEYYVTFGDDGSDYSFKENLGDENDVHPIDFGKLSGTLRPESKTRNNVNHSIVDYNGEDTTTTAAQITRARLDSTIVLPDEEEIQTGQYTSANWNAAFYYINATIQKTWKDQRWYTLQGTQIQLNLDGRTAVENSEAVSFAAYRMKQVNKSTNGLDGVQLFSIQGEGDTALSTATNNKGTSTVTTPVRFAVTTEAKKGSDNFSSYHWRATNIALQAEGSSGRISYSLSEAAVPSGYDVTYISELNHATGQMEYKAINIQRHGTIEFTTVTNKDTLTGINGVQYKLYYLNCTDSSHDHSANLNTAANKQGACWTLAVDTQNSNPKVRYENLPIGTYRLAEVKTLAGLALPTVQWTLEVIDTSDPENRIQLDDSSFLTLNGTPPMEVEEGKKPDYEEIEPVDTQMYKSSDGYKIVNIVLYKLPNSGGMGTYLFTLFGSSMLAAVLFLLLEERKKGKMNKGNHI